MGPDLTERDYQRAARLGASYKVYSGDVSAFRIEVAKRIAEHATALGFPSDYPVPMADRARIRTQVAIGFFRDQYGRDPEDAREIAATIAKHSRPRTTAVAGGPCWREDFQAVHGRPPTPIESIQLAQQATLETRDAKKEPRSWSSSAPPGGPRQHASWAVRRTSTRCSKQASPITTPAVISRVTVRKDRAITVGVVKGWGGVIG